MNVIYYPDSSSAEGEPGPIQRFFKKLIKEHPPKLWLQVKDILVKVGHSSSLKDLEQDGVVGQLKHVNLPIFEFRIPPRKKGGVVRLYFAYKKDDPNTIIILSAEKKKKSQADPVKIDQAKKRYREVCL